MMVLIIAPGKSPIVSEIDGSLKSMQDIVGGYIQAFYLWWEEVAIICNDEGKIHGLPSIVRFLMNMANCWISSQVRFLSVARRQTVKVLQIYQKN